MGQEGDAMRVSRGSRQQALRVAAAIAGLLTLAAGCGEKKVVCPAGYRVSGIYCEPLPPGVGAEDSGGVSDGAIFDAVADAAVEDATTDASGEETAEWDGLDGSADTAKDVAFDAGKDASTGSKSPIGAACEDGLDCKAGLECFAWPDGYCTVPSCSPSSPCPGSASCWGADPKSLICVAGCELNTDCRVAEGYACKRLTQAFGGVDAQLCLPSGAKKAGLTCKGPLDCQGEATCLLDMPGGYCARVGCGKGDPCEAGTACVLRDGKPLCLKTCDVDADCQVGAGLPRICALRTDLTKVQVKVCLDTDKAAPVGGACLADLDCQSGKCTIVAKGTCQVGGMPCLTDGQCGANGPCDLAKEKEKGVCTQPCAKDKACPLGALCVPGPDGLAGSCAPGCQGPGDAETCKTPGTECVYGQPIAVAGGVATPGYACAARPMGSAGANCIATSECQSGGNCFTNIQKTAGYCQVLCGPGKSACAFGTTCVDSGIAFCERICSVDYDCPVQMICGSGPSPKTCTLP